MSKPTNNKTGVFPHGSIDRSKWKTVRLGEIGTFFKGRAFSKGDISPIGQYRAIHYGELFTQYGPIIQNVSSRSDVGPPEGHCGDILFPTSDVTPDGLGRCSALLADDVVLGGDLLALRPKHGIDSRFLSLAINHEKQQIIDRVSGTTVKHISASALANVSVNIPSIIEQNQIATTFDSIENRLSALSFLVAKHEAIKKSTLKLLFAPKNGWKTIQLGNVCNIVRGGSPRPIDQYLTRDTMGIPWIKIGDVAEGEKYITRTAERIIPEGVSRSRLVEVGDFVLSNSMSFGRPYIVRLTGCIHDGWLAIQQYQHHFDPEFLYYLLVSEKVLRQYEEGAAGSSVKNLNKAIVGSLVVPCPTLSEQRRIAANLAAIDEVIASTTSERAKVESIKAGLMQYYFG